MWDTARNNGVLIYVLTGRPRLEIVADRGIHQKVGQEAWEIICRDMGTAFSAGDYQGSVIAGIEAIGAHLARHYPVDGQNDKELPDTPVLL